MPVSELWCSEAMMFKSALQVPASELWCLEV